uniref:Aminoglycoside phosphotransferase domain-containing protein n=1 Tax=Bionectria ochroleuca TaxID=29856 RepID=A0A8H7NNU8_BIOOC
MLVVTTMATSNLGSASWNNADDYEPGAELHTRAVKFLDAINWEALTSLASKLRDGTPCRIEQPYSIGHFNMVRRITFTDDVSWVARLRMPNLDAVFGSRESLDPTSLMRVEVATMKYLSRNTSVPVPEVYHYDFNRNNSIGAPFIMMSYIHGNAASELRLQKDCPPRLFRTPEQDRTFRRQMADIQIELAAIQFDRIGSLYEDGDSFTIGPEPETGDGPWDTAADYYRSWMRHLVEVAERDADPEVKKKPSFNLPQSFLPLMHQYSIGLTSCGPFRLVNRDFGAHNLLVDDNFNIVGLIDLDGVMAAPIDLVAQFPALTGLDRETPGTKRQSQLPSNASWLPGRCLPITNACWHHLNSSPSRKMRVLPELFSPTGSHQTAPPLSMACQDSRGIRVPPMIDGWVLLKDTWAERHWTVTQLHKCICLFLKSAINKKYNTSAISPAICQQSCVIMYLTKAFISKY